MIERVIRLLSAARPPTLRCSSCDAAVPTYAIDGTELRECVGCLAFVLADADALLDERDRLYEGASWAEWAELHGRHGRRGCVGCPLCGMEVH